MTDTVPSQRYELADRYRQDEGRVFMSGIQALARLPLEQLRADKAAGLDTAAFVCGYQGSPLAGYDREVASVGRLGVADGYRFVAQPGLNEELAATALMGSQLASTIDGFRHDGVVGVWYGKAPGLDRAGDAIRHGVFAGASAKGGVVLLVGDDPAAKSSTLPSSSDGTLVELDIPVFNPGDVQEALDLGRHAIALSRVSGLWSALKIVAAVADGTGTIDLHAERFTSTAPETLVGGHPFVPRPSGRLLTPYTLDVERELLEVRLDIARRYGALNRLNAVDVGAPDAWIGVVATGQTYRELLEALRLLGLDTPARIERAGIRLLKLAMPVPLDRAVVREFARGLTEIVVVEEKSPTLEMVVKDALYDLSDRPRVVGKHDEAGERLVPLVGGLDGDVIAALLRRRLVQRIPAENLAPLAGASRNGASKLLPLTISRTPYFCSGCPHNISTKVPEHSLVGGGIGCHAMVALMEGERVGELAGLTAMGNEGAQWVGMAPFVDDQHLIQNLGDGTFFHSGSLAIRFAVAAGVNMTYKLLYNGTVAMTGGQDAVGAVGVPEVARMLLLEGVNEVLITTDQPKKYRRASLPDGVEVWDRRRIIEAQEHLAAVAGVTVLIHDQECAAEKRRARKRGKVAEPATRVIINERVCEGCGDCGAKSNCLSVQPVETAFGRKTTIDQSSCNLDYSCLEGDCPSFMTVEAKHGARPLAKQPPRAFGDDDDELALPPPLFDTDRWAVRMSGIGGTGVVTVSQVLGTAAMLDGLLVRGLDQTGLSQKAGPVVSDLRFSRDEPQPSNRATEGMVDLYLAFDLLVGASESHLVGASHDRTVVIGSVSPTPTGAMVVHPEIGQPSTDALRRRLDGMSRADVNRYVDAAAIVAAMFGDETVTNLFLVGVAAQAGALALRPESIERAVELNGVAVDRNIEAFRWGRKWVVDPEGVRAAAGIDRRGTAAERDPFELRTSDLEAYQSKRLAGSYRAAVERVAAREHEVAAGSTALTDAVVVNLHKLMAYKDEYEVARLILAPEARAAAEAVAGPGAKVAWQLHPPVLRSMGMKRKVKLGRWATPMFAILRALRRVRGHWFDPFGHTEVRRLERALIEEYVVAIDRLLAGLRADNIAEATAIAELPDQVRGYEQLKLERAEIYRAELDRRLARYETS